MSETTYEIFGMPVRVSEHVPEGVVCVASGAMAKVVEQMTRPVAPLASPRERETPDVVARVTEYVNAYAAVLRGEFSGSRIVDENAILDDLRALCGLASRPAETENAGLTHSGPCAACGQTIPATPAETAPVAWAPRVTGGKYAGRVLIQFATREREEIGEFIKRESKHPFQLVGIDCEPVPLYAHSLPSPSAEPTEEQVEPTDLQVALAATELVGLAHLLCQPNRGDVFSWIDDHRHDLARAALRASGGR